MSGSLSIRIDSVHTELFLQFFADEIEQLGFKEFLIFKTIHVPEFILEISPAECPFWPVQKIDYFQLCFLGEKIIEYLYFFIKFCIHKIEYLRELIYIGTLRSIKIRS